MALRPETRRDVKAHQCSPLPCPLVIEWNNARYTPRWRAESRGAEQHASDPAGSPHRIGHDLVFPHTNHVPAVTFKTAAIGDISGDVFSKLIGPKVRAGSRPNIVLRATMPEASIDKHDDSPLRKHQVWPSRKDSDMQAVPESERP
jgi:hypothetical protein